MWRRDFLATSATLSLKKLQYYWKIICQNSIYYCNTMERKDSKIWNSAVEKVENVTQNANYYHNSSRFRDKIYLLTKFSAVATLLPSFSKKKGTYFLIYMRTSSGLGVVRFPLRMISSRLHHSGLTYSTILTHSTYTVVQWPYMAKQRGQFCL